MTNIKILDTAIEAKRLLDSTPNCLQPVCLGAKLEAIHVFHGIEILARAAKAIIKTSSREDEYPIEKQFSYRGVKFFQIGTAEDFETVGALAHAEMPHG